MSHHKTITVHEFWQLGFLQELNRQFLHPLGLALEVEVDEKGHAKGLGRIWDYRDDPEGIIFETGNVVDFREKAARVEAHRELMSKSRIARLGYWVQPVPPASGSVSTG